MRQAVLTFLAALLGVLVAQFAFHLYARHEAELARAAADAEMQARVEQGRKLAELTLAQQAETQAIRNDVAAVSVARVVVSEAYMTTGRMPGSNAEAGLTAPETYHGQSLRSLKVLEGGRIALEFDASSGVDGGVIEWRPDLSGIESMGLQWECTTRDYAEIVRSLPGCRYVGGNHVDAAASPQS